MKVKFEIDSTPEEWRRFFGMPDVTEVHAELIAQAKAKIAAGEFDTSAMMKQFMPENMHKMAEMQQQFWDSLFKQK